MYISSFNRVSFGQKPALHNSNQSQGKVKETSKPETKEKKDNVKKGILGGGAILAAWILGDILLDKIVDAGSSKEYDEKIEKQIKDIQKKSEKLSENLKESTREIEQININFEKDLKEARLNSISFEDLDDGGKKLIYENLPIKLYLGDGNKDKSCMHVDYNDPKEIAFVSSNIDIIKEKESLFKYVDKIEFKNLKDSNSSIFNLQDIPDLPGSPLSVVNHRYPDFIKDLSQKEPDKKILRFGIDELARMFKSF